MSACNLFPAANSHSDPSAQNNPFGHGFGCDIDCMIAVHNGGDARGCWRSVDHALRPRAYVDVLRVVARSAGRECSAAGPRRALAANPSAALRARGTSSWLRAGIGSSPWYWGLWWHLLAFAVEAAAPGRGAMGGDAERRRSALVGPGGGGPGSRRKGFPLLFMAIGCRKLRSGGGAG